MRVREVPAGADPRRVDDRGATLVFVLVLVTVMSVASLAVARFSFGSAKAEQVHSGNQRLSDALDVAAAAGMDAVRAAGNACPTPTTTSPWPLTIHDVDGLAAPPNNLAPVDVRLDCSATGEQLTVSATRVVTCAAGPAVADVSRLTLTLLRTTVGESAMPSLQVQQRSVTDLTGCGAP